MLLVPAGGTGFVSSGTSATIGKREIVSRLPAVAKW
jgi:hypothetical protein